uniref:Uncharacterized protein n=1 Tax=Rhizophora mucronata TaxID=61149 RepID=A0A2P2KYB0_RHIMU
MCVVPITQMLRSKVLNY